MVARATEGGTADDGGASASASAVDPELQSIISGHLACGSDLARNMVRIVDVDRQLAEAAGAAFDVAATYADAYRSVTATMHATARRNGRPSKRRRRSSHGRRRSVSRSRARRRRRRRLTSSSEASTGSVVEPVDDAAE